MNKGWVCFFAVSILGVSLAGGDKGVLAVDPKGKRPQYLSSELSSVPNEQAITTMIWAPGFDEGYVPQGITFAEGAVLLSGYKSTDTRINNGPCRVFRVDPISGDETGHFDLPDDCGHAGGLAYLGKGSLVVSDSRRLYKINMAKAFQDGHTRNALMSKVKLARELKGDFVAFDGTALWLGSYEKEPTRAKLFRLGLDIFNRFNGKGTLRKDQALSNLPIPIEAQGAAIDKQGNLWLTFSTGRYGSLRRIDPRTGAVLAEYKMVVGIEDIEFDDEGKLWSVSEAGSQRWSYWPQTFPVLFQIDVSRLSETSNRSVHGAGSGN